MKALLSSFVGASFLLLLCGCGGGGGGGTGGGPLTLVSWSSIVPPATIETGGLSLESAVTYTQRINDSPLVSTVSDNPDFYEFAEAEITYDAGGIIEQIELRPLNIMLSWDAAAINYSDDNTLIYAIDSLEADVAVAINPEAVGWEYQTFGVWENGRAFSSGYIGAMSMGAVTPQEAVPVPPGPESDQVYFNGRTNGIFVDQNEIDYYVYSDLSVLVDFQPNSANTTLAFATSNNYKVEMDTLIDAGLPGTNTNDGNFAISGTLTYSPITNQFTGQLVTPIMSGDSTGQFYGPAAEELGGVFFLIDSESNPTMYYSGAYGATQ